MTEDLQQQQDHSRRYTPDFWVRLLPWLAIAGWLCLIGGLVILALAKPEFETYFDRYSFVRRRPAWDRELARYILYAMILGLGIGSFGLSVNLRRLKRKRDQLWYSFIFTILASVFGIVMYLINF